jgi:hypothetical protein
MPDEAQPLLPQVEPANKESAKPVQKVSKRDKPKRAPRAKGSESAGVKGASRTRKVRPYPAYTFEQSLPLIEAIWTFGAGEQVRRLTLLKQMEKSPTSSGVQNLITNSAKYGLTRGSYLADFLTPTELGKKATDPQGDARTKRRAQFELAIEGVAPFKALYDAYKGRKLAVRDVMKDVLRAAKLDIEDEAECVDTFIVNAKYLGLLQQIGGAETLVSIDHVLDELPASNRGAATAQSLVRDGAEVNGAAAAGPSRAKWSDTCFYIAPIGDAGSEQRKHSDLFLRSVIEPALKEFGLTVVRADDIAEAGMITSQIIEHIMRSRMAIVDLSFHNPNVFYEMALRHACKLPVVQITRKADRLPFDVSQVRTIVIDTSDIYTLVPQLETYRSEVAAQVRAALTDDALTSNPVSVFFPQFVAAAIKS